MVVNNSGNGINVGGTGFFTGWEGARTEREADAKDAGWRYWSDGLDLHLICAVCAHREFRLNAPASTDAA
jgi:hypothetical protein